MLLLAGAACALSPLPAGLNEFSRLSGRAGALRTIRRATAAAVGRALADGVELMEVEFPPLLETKTQFDDFSNVEVLDANRDFGVQLATEPEIRGVASDAQLWLCFADEGEAELAREAWPGALYGAATSTYISAAGASLGLGPPATASSAPALAAHLEALGFPVHAVKDVGGEPLMPMGSSALSAASMLGGLFGSPPPPPPPPPSQPATLQLVVQPGDGGPMEDWLNLELLRQVGSSGGDRNPRDP